MNRLDVYTAVHKMQRARLFELTVEAGKTDPPTRRRPLGWSPRSTPWPPS